MKTKPELFCGGIKTAMEHQKIKKVAKIYKGCDKNVFESKRYFLIYSPNSSTGIIGL